MADASKLLGAIRDLSDAQSNYSQALREQDYPDDYTMYSYQKRVDEAEANLTAALNEFIDERVRESLDRHIEHCHSSNDQ